MDDIARAEVALSGDSPRIECGLDSVDWPAYHVVAVRVQLKLLQHPRETRGRVPPWIQGQDDDGDVFIERFARRSGLMNHRRAQGLAMSERERHQRAAMLQGLE
jgi:hypothetical protein